MARSTRLLGTAGGDLDEAAQILAHGGLVALPTETVYGLAARGLDEEGVRAIFAAKGRPQDNPVILHVASPADAWPLWRFGDDDAGRAEGARARTLASAFWPGPLTIVARKSAVVPDVVTAGLDKVAVRVPAHDAFVRVLVKLGEPLAAPSANASSRPSPTTAADVLASLDGRIDAVVDGGPCRFGIESTVVDVTGPRPRVLRLGATSLAEIRAFLPDAAALRGTGPGAIAVDAHEAALASPGLRHKHYAPAGARVVLVDDAELAARWTSSTALLVRASTAAGLAAEHGARGAVTEVLPDDAAGYARGLYAALYRLEKSAPTAHVDDRGGDGGEGRGERTIVVENVPADAAWDAVRDRLVRASSS